MALLNIGASNKDDAFYRYKMPKMITKTEGRGNGIKTNVVNMVEIAKALGRPASYTTKYFGCELGAQSKFDEKTGTSHVNGAHDTAKLAGLLENFIKKFVQCYGCGNPETEIIITKTQMITLKCAACGFISDVDMRDKLTTFILKNPPERKKGSKDKKSLRRAEKERLMEGEAADEEQKKVKKEIKKKGVSGSLKDKGLKKKSQSHASDEDSSPPRTENGQVVNDDDEDEVQWQTDTSREAAEQRIKEQLSAVTADMVMLSTIEEKKKDMGSKSGEYPAKAHESSNDSVIDARGKLVEDIKAHLRKGCSASELKSFLAPLSVDPQEKMDALFSALFEGAGKGFSKEVVKKKNYLAAVAQQEGSQMVLLHAIESFCGRAAPEAVKEVALVLKVLYDGDVLEEEIVLEWYQKGLTGSQKSSIIWEDVKPFVEWLQNAESETDEE